jgi:hypothetical protein
MRYKQEWNKEHGTGNAGKGDCIDWQEKKRWK